MTHLITSDQFIKFAVASFRHLGASMEAASTTAAVLLEASLSGYDSHGIMRIPRYVNECRKGIIVASATPSIIKDSGPIALIDGNFSLGPFTADYAASLAVSKAREFGISAVTCKNTNDIARLGSYVQKHAEQGMLLVLFANDAGTGGSVPPWGGFTEFLSTNPIAAGIPTNTSSPLIIDVSTGTTSVGKVRQASNLGEYLADGILLLPSGQTTTDPDIFFRSPKGASILPLGGLLAGHKGFALGLLVEALAGALTQAGCSTGINVDYSRNGLFVVGIDPEKFGGLISFKDSMTNLIQALKSLDKLAGVEEILVPGERSSREREKRLIEGIPVDAPTWEKLLNIGKEVGISITST